MDLIEPTDVDYSPEANRYTYYAPYMVSSSPSCSVSVSVPSLPFPDSLILDPEGRGLFKMLAMRITKWRKLAMYLGLPDDAIATISQANHFDNECCYKMMLMWTEKYNELATYLKLANSLRNIMRDDLLMEVTRYLPEVEEEGGGESGEDGWEPFPVITGSSNLYSAPPPSLSLPLFRYDYVRYHIVENVRGGKNYLICSSESKNLTVLSLMVENVFPLYIINKS